MNNPNDTPRTDGCLYCGSIEQDTKGNRTFYVCGTYQTKGCTPARSSLCCEIEERNEWQKRAEGAEAEVERLKSQLNRAVEIAETACKYLHTGGWNEDEMYSGKVGWVTETEIDEVCATLAVLKSEIK